MKNDIGAILAALGMLGFLVMLCYGISKAWQVDWLFGLGLTSFSLLILGLILDDSYK